MRTQLQDGTDQLVTINGGGGGLSETTEEVEISAEGSHIRIEITLNSDDLGGLFLIESIDARGRPIRKSSTRTGDAT